MKINWREVLIIILIFVVVFAAVHFSVQSFRVDGPSMLPSFHAGEFLMVNKLTYRFSDPHRGDVIVFWPPFQSDYPFIKRVIGVPGDLVEVKDGQVYINGSLLDETPDKGLSSSDISWLVEKDHYFVMGDNRGNSRDSTGGWTVPRKNIIGKSWLTYWPLSDWGLSPKYHSELVVAA